MKKRKVHLYSQASLNLLMLPAFILVLIFCYLPLGGLVIAFQNYDFVIGGVQAFWLSPWVGFDQFKQIFARGSDGVRILTNTLTIASLKIFFNIAIPLCFALLLNEIRKVYFKRAIQTLIYLPNFLSWIIFGGIIRQMLLYDGTINILLQHIFGVDFIPFLSDNRYFVPTLIATEVWKNFGFGTIIYLAALAGVDPTHYEAAVLDGANRWQQTWSITLPSILPIVTLVAVMSLQGILDAGFDQIFNLYNPLVYKTADIIDTYIYRLSFANALPNYSLATAIGLFKGFVSLILIVVTYNISHRLTGYRVF